MILTERYKKPAIFAVSLLLLAAVAVLDYFTKESVSVVLLYLIPVSAAAWWAGMAYGVILAALSCFSWLAVDILVFPAHGYSFIPYWNWIMETLFFVVNAVLLGLLRRSLEREKMRARMDSLTGIMNRYAFYESAHLEIERAKRYKYPITLGFIDIDDFKKINDNFGHSKGDEVLKNVADTIKHNVRANDIFARIGGDEFVLLLPGVNPKSSRRIFSRIRNDIEKSPRKEPPITASIGATTFMKVPDTPEELITETDSIMYAVKRSVKNNVRYKNFK